MEQMRGIMKIKFIGILTEDAALKAVENNGYALQCVLDKAMFVAIAEKLKIDIEI
jgi:hypothetical protein